MKKEEIKKEEISKDEITVCNPVFAGKKCVASWKEHKHNDGLAKLDQTIVNLTVNFKDETIAECIFDMYDDKGMNTRFSFCNIVVSDNVNYPILKDFIEKLSEEMGTNMWCYLEDENHNDRSYLENLF